MMHKYMIGYGVWNKQDMVGWLLEGIGAYAPEVSCVHFVFDSCVDASEANFDIMYSQLIKNVARTAHVHITKWASKEPLHEIGIHDAIMHHFMNETDCDVLIVPQDDQRICDPILLRMEGMLGHFGSRIGLIGGRDGYFEGLSKIVGSVWSESVLTERLQPGVWCERPFLNSGPLIYTRDMITKVGYHDRQFEHWYAWDDYCMRCRDAGLTSAVVGTGIRHIKFGRAPNTTYYTDGSGDRDRARFRSKWGKKAW